MDIEMVRVICATVVACVFVAGLFWFLVKTLGD